jgi:hypothetical protein
MDDVIALDAARIAEYGVVRDAGVVRRGDVVRRAGFCPALSVGELMRAGSMWWRVGYRSSRRER